MRSSYKNRLMPRQCNFQISAFPYKAKRKIDKFITFSLSEQNKNGAKRAKWSESGVLEDTVFSLPKPSGMVTDAIAQGFREHFA